MATKWNKWNAWLSAQSASGTGPVELRPIRRGSAYIDVLYLSGNRAADTFDVDVKLSPGGTELAEFTVTVGAYNAETDKTPLTLELASSTTAFASAPDEGDGVIYLVWEALRNANGTGAFVPFMAGSVTVLEGVADGA